MTRPERYEDNDGKMPILCPTHTTPNGNGIMLAEFDITGVYLWCKKCHKPHYLSYAQLRIAAEQHVQTSACLERVL